MMTLVLSYVGNFLIKLSQGSNRVTHIQSTLKESTYDMLKSPTDMENGNC